MCIFPLQADFITGDATGGDNLVTIPVADKTLQTEWGKAALKSLQNLVELLFVETSESKS